MGVLSFRPDDEELKNGLRLGLKDHGYAEGKNISIEWREAGGNLKRADEMAQELVGLEVDVIVALLTPAALAAKKASSTVPIVFASAGDPVATGLVSNLARPEGNITGITSATADLGGKLLELAMELRPETKRVAVILDETPFAKTFFSALQSTAPTAGVELYPIRMSDFSEIGTTFQDIGKRRIDVAIVQPVYAREGLAELAIKNRIATITTGSGARLFPRIGGLMSYGTNPTEQYRRAADYVDKILKGAKPRDLPVQQPTSFELTINLKTAKAIGLRVPESLAQRADNVIE